MKTFKINFNLQSSMIIQKEKLNNLLIKQIILLGLDNKLINNEIKLLIERLIGQQIDFEKRLLENILQGE